MIVLLAGTSGTGKSTLAALLAARLGITTLLSTDSIRHMLRSFHSRQEAPLLYASTYQVGWVVICQLLAAQCQICRLHSARTSLCCVHSLVRGSEQPASCWRDSIRVCSLHKHAGRSLCSSHVPGIVLSSSNLPSWLTWTTNRLGLLRIML